MDQLRFSVVIPAYNEEDLLPRCLAALMPIARAAGADVFVIDNNSTDRTAEIARVAGATVINEPRQGVVFALQRGLEAATGDIVAFSDADSIVDANWLNAARTALVDQTVVAASGPIQFEHMKFLSNFRRFTRRMIFGSNMAVRKGAALAAGGFDTRYNLASDIALGWAIKKQGRIVFAQDMKVMTSARRFQVHPFKETVRYMLNHLWMLAFHRPLFWNFKTVRKPEHELLKLQTRMAITTAILAFLVIFVYLSFWPSSTVFGLVHTRAHTHEKIIALTFDDGPNGAATRHIVDILTAAKVPATFFEVGRSVIADPATSKYVSDHGFLIENHSWDHVYQLPYLTPHRIKAELVDTNNAITTATGQVPTLFRPPHGFRSPQLIAEARFLKLQLVGWSVDPQDYYTGNSKTIINRVLKHAHRGSIVLLHDGLQDGFMKNKLADRKGTIAALPEIIKQLQARGYIFVTVPELLKKVPETGRDIL